MCACTFDLLRRLGTDHPLYARRLLELARMTEIDSAGWQRVRARERVGNST